MGCCELFALRTRMDHDVIDSKHRNKLDPSAIASWLLQQIERLKDGQRPRGINAVFTPPGREDCYC